MNILLSTYPIISNPQTFAKIIEAFDPKFSDRYLGKNSWDNTPELMGEGHWECDKHTLFFLEIPDAEIKAFVDAMAENKEVQRIYQLDDDFEVTGKALFNKYAHMPKPDIAFKTHPQKPAWLNPHFGPPPPPTL